MSRTIIAGIWVAFFQVVHLGCILPGVPAIIVRAGAGDYQRDVGAAARPAAWLSGPSLVDGANMYACDPALACDSFRMNYDALKMPVRHPGPF